MHCPSVLGAHALQRHQFLCTPDNHMPTKKRQSSTAGKPGGCGPRVGSIAPIFPADSLKGGEQIGVLFTHFQFQGCKDIFWRFIASLPNGSFGQIALRHKPSPFAGGPSWFTYCSFTAKCGTYFIQAFLSGTTFA